MEGAFRSPGLKLIETFGWDGAGYSRLARHLARLEASAAALGFAHDPGAVQAALPRDPGPGALRVRMTLDRAGKVEVTTAPLAPASGPWRLALSDQRLNSADLRLAHKTTDRVLYDRTRADLPAGVDEVIFLNQRDEVAEGTITTVFFDLGQGLKTPPRAAGCLPGCLRAELLDLGLAHEAPLAAADLPRARLWVGNSLRGLIPAVLR